LYLNHRNPAASMAIATIIEVTPAGTPIDWADE
jgi:hypothetical protein